MERKIIEYRVCDGPIEEIDLEDFGKDGWELIAVTQPRHTVPPVFYFKRVKCEKCS